MESKHFEKIKRTHECLLVDQEQATIATKEAGALESQQEPQWVPEAVRFLRDISAAGKDISNPHRRSQLRAILRYWEDQIYEIRGEMFKTELQPALEEPPDEEPAHKSLKARFRHARILMLGLAAVLVAFAGLVLDSLLYYDRVVCLLSPYGRWCPQNDRNLKGTHVFSLASCGDGTLFAGAADGIYRRGAGGTEWDLVWDRIGFNVTGLVASPDCELVYAVVPRLGVLRCDDGSWSVVSPQGEMAQSFTIALTGSTILAGGKYGIRYSVADQSDTWVKPLSPTPVDKQVSSLVRSDGRIYAAVWGDGPWYCHKDDLVWHPENNGLDTAKVLQVVGSPADGAPRFAVADNTLFRWNGIRWEKGPETWSGTPISWVVTDGVTAYAGLELDGVLRSSDGGLTWEQMNAGWEPPFRVHTLLIHVAEDGRQWLYAGTSDGVWRYLLGKAPICNGDFEHDFECWQHGGELDQTVECYGDQCYAVLGNPDYLCRGGVPVGEAWIRQTVKVPWVISPTLSLRYRVFSYDLDLPGYDYFQITVNGEPLSERYGNWEWNEASCDREPWDSGWMKLALDLSAFRGEEVEMSFHNVNGTQPYFNTWTYVDDIGISGVR